MHTMVSMYAHKIDMPGENSMCLSVQRVRKTALEIAQNVTTQPDLLVVELGAFV